MDTKFSLINYN